METRGGRVHHAYGRCAPYIRNSRTIHAVPMHHHPRFCCSLGAAYAGFIRAIKKHNKIYLIEDLFRKVIVPAEAVGITKYILYVLAYSVYGMIRAMIDQGFSETPEQIGMMFAEHNSI